MSFADLERGEGGFRRTGGSGPSPLGGGNGSGNNSGGSNNQWNSDGNPGTHFVAFLGSASSCNSEHVSNFE